MGKVIKTRGVGALVFSKISEKVDINNIDEEVLDIIEEYFKREL